MMFRADLFFIRVSVSYIPQVVSYTELAFGGTEFQALLSDLLLDLS